MNIVVKTSAGKYIVRPDTTRAKDCSDFFPPEFVDRISYTPVLFARICKPGRSIGEEFSDRYYDAVGYGILLYPQDMLDGSEAGFACASFLPLPLFDKDSLGEGKREGGGEGEKGGEKGGEGDAFRLRVKKEAKTAKQVFSYSGGTTRMIERAIAEATRFVLLRAGDLLAIELGRRRPLCRRSDTDVAVAASYGGTLTMDFRIRY